MARSHRIYLVCDSHMADEIRAAFTVKKEAFAFIDSQAWKIRDRLRVYPLPDGQPIMEWPKPIER